MSSEAIDTLLLIVEFMGLGVVAFGVGYGSAWLIRLFDAAATLKG